MGKDLCIEDLGGDGPCSTVKGIRFSYTKVNLLLWETADALRFLAILLLLLREQSKRVSSHTTEYNWNQATLDTDIIWIDIMSRKNMCCLPKGKCHVLR